MQHWTASRVTCCTIGLMKSVDTQHCRSLRCPLAAYASKRVTALCACTLDGFHPAVLADYQPKTSSH